MGAPGWQQWLRLEVAVGMEPSAKNRGGGDDAFVNSKEHFSPQSPGVPTPILLLLNYLNNCRFTRSLKEMYRALFESFTQPLQI